MSKDKVIDSLSGIDDDMVQEVEILRQKRKKAVWIRWGALAACVALIVTIGMYAAGHWATSSPAVIKSIYVNNRQYFPAEDSLTQAASEENVGEFLGYVTLDYNEKKTNIRAYNYIPEDGKTNRIIISYHRNYYVYEFAVFWPDGSENWPMDLLADAARIEVCEAENGGEKVFMTLADADSKVELLGIISELEKQSQREINRRYYDLFKDHFAEGEIWFDEEDGGIKKTSIGVSVKLTRLICANERYLVFVMADNTRMILPYLPNSRVLLCDSFGYFLTDEQVEQINRLIGLE